MVTLYEALTQGHAPRNAKLWSVYPPQEDAAREALLIVATIASWKRWASDAQDQISAEWHRVVLQSRCSDILLWAGRVFAGYPAKYLYVAWDSDSATLHVAEDDLRNIYEVISQLPEEEPTL